MNATKIDDRRLSYAMWQELAGRWERGRRILGHATRQVTDWLVEQLAPAEGQTILELAAGTGEAGFIAAGHLGARGRLISSDFAPHMVEAARRVATELRLDNVELRILDAERLELRDGGVDGVLCQFGYMLMADPGLALRETRRVLRADGRLAFSVWGDPQRNPWASVPASVMVGLGHMPRRDPDAPGMFTLRDEAKLRALVAAAGFARCEVKEVAVRHAFRDADALWAFTSELQGPIALAIGLLGEGERRTVRSTLEQRCAPFRVADGYELPGVALCAVAS